jgi:energy-coupling factor transporter ATP-binding protein EcfA2
VTKALKELELADLPPIVVLYGPNGSGKSNVLRAVQLVLRAAAQSQTPGTQEDPCTLTLSEADARLDLRPEDFRFGDHPEIRVELEIDIGQRAMEILLPPSKDSFSHLYLEGVFQLGPDKQINYWLGRVDIDGSEEVATPFLKQRIHQNLIPQLLQISEAYRVSKERQDPEGALYDKLLSEDLHEREAAGRLSRHLSQAQLFGPGTDPVALVPVNSKTYNEHQVRIRHPVHGELPLRNLGSGEQQLVMMLAQRVITPFPIAHLEEPEAHLHKTLMEPFARVLRDSVLGNGDQPDVDQLWITTHHRYFNLASEFFDVSLDEEGSTRIVRRPRDEAAEHFYEPSPYLDTLRHLVESGMSPEAVVYRDEQDNPITAKDVMQSLEGDQELAKKFVDSATRAFVLSLREEESEQ